MQITAYQPPAQPEKQHIGLPRSHIDQNSFIFPELNIHLKYKKNKIVSVNNHFFVYYNEKKAASGIFCPCLKIPL